MKKILSLAIAATASLWAASAFPCGAPFGAGVNVDPKQDIIVTHHAGTETYVFQPTFCGDAHDFGLILPVPSTLSSMPELSEAAAFTAVDDLSKPAVVKKTECRSRGGVGGADDAGSFGTDGTTVVASGRVGFLDWTQIKADSESSFTAWLDANGYTYDPAAKTTFASYVSKGWYFLAFKINQGAPTGTDNCRALGPIKLSFPSATPVVPSKIATAGQTIDKHTYPPGFSWRVFAITDGSEQIDFAEGSDGYKRKLGFSGVLSAGDASKLAGLAKAGDRMTKLTLWFDGTDADDVALGKKPAVDYRDTVYDVTYVDCDEDAGPVDPAADAGPAATNAANGGSTGCSTTHPEGPAGSSFAALAIVAAAVARLRRR